MNPAAIRERGGRGGDSERRGDRGLQRGRERGNTKTERGTSHCSQSDAIACKDSRLKQKAGTELFGQQCALQTWSASAPPQSAAMARACARVLAWVSAACKCVFEHRPAAGSAAIEHLKPRASRCAGHRWGAAGLAQVERPGLRAPGVPNAAEVDARDHVAAVVQLDNAPLRRRRDPLVFLETERAGLERQEAGRDGPGLCALGTDARHAFPVDSADIVDIDSCEFSAPVPPSSIAVRPSPRKACNPPKIVVSRLFRVSPEVCCR